MQNIQQEQKICTILQAQIKCTLNRVLTLFGHWITKNLYHKDFASFLKPMFLGLSMTVMGQIIYRFHIQTNTFFGGQMNQYPRLWKGTYLHTHSQSEGERLRLILLVFPYAQFNLKTLQKFFLSSWKLLAVQLPLSAEQLLFDTISIFTKKILS